MSKTKKQSQKVRLHFDVTPEINLLIETTYNYLVARPHPWRRQLYIKGRNMTVGHLIYSMRTNSLSEEEAASDFDLPLPAIKETLHYYTLNKELIEMEALEEKRSLQKKGYKLEP